MVKTIADSTENQKSETVETPLADAAHDWCPDETAVAPLEAATISDPFASSTTPVAIITDPFGFHNIEVSEAQNIEDELDLDDDFSDEIIDELDISAIRESLNNELEDVDFIEEKSPSEVDQEMSSLAQAVAVEQAKLEVELEALSAETAENQSKLLAAQIAEDEALAQHLAEEAGTSEALEEEDPEVLAALPQVDAEGNLDLQELESCVEALLFISDKPLSTDKLKELLSTETQEIPFALLQEALTSLRDRYQRIQHGIELVEVNHGLQFRTKPGRAALAKKLAKVQTQRLSSGAMETLAIVAYRQPALKDDIDKVRGVDSSHFIRGLLDKKLIRISGRSELPGRPMVYSTAPEFLELFGLKDLAALPPLRELEQMVPKSQSDNPEDEDPRVKEMRRLVGQMKADDTRLAYDPREDEKILTEIRERVKEIPTSTPYLDEQKAQEKAALEAAKAPKLEVPADLAELMENLIPQAPGPLNHLSI